MKQMAQNYKSGEPAVLDASAPVCRPGGLLPSSDDLAVADVYHLAGSRRGTATLKFYEARDIPVDTARIVRKPVTRGSRLIS